MSRKPGQKQVPSRVPPDLPGPDGLPLLDIDALLSGLPFEESRAEGLDLAGKKIPALTAKDSLLDKISFAGCEVLSLRLRDVRVSNCDFSNAVLRGFEATRVELIDCRLIGMRAIECRWKDVLVENCDARYAQFNDGQLVSCEFKGSHMGESDLRATDLEGTRFTNVVLQRADRNDEAGDAYRKAV